MVSMSISARVLRTLLFLFLVLCAIPLFAQQTGSISGKVTATDGSGLPGVTVEARSDVLPGPRVTVTAAHGEYRLPALPPGSYTLKFDLSGMKSVTRSAQVQLAQDTVADASLGIAAAEAVTVTAAVSLIDKESATIASGLSNQQIKALPVAQEYRDLQKLIPAVQYTEELTRGPSAGGSGQDNVYLFDGANVSLPLYGNLSAEPASHDIAQITVINGGARALDFNRSGGFLMDSVSKSGTAAFHGQAGYQFQTAGMSAGLNTGILSRYEQDRKWWDASIGGPIWSDHLFFYGSYYRPEQKRQNRANLYGDLPPYDSTRNEGFGKLTVTPSQALLFNLSYRDSKRIDKSDLFASNAAATTGSGNQSKLRIGTADGSWVINNRSFATVKYTHFENLTQGRPDNISSAVPTNVIGTRLDVANLDKLGLLTVPILVSGNAAYNAFVQPIIDKYGYTLNGVKTGGGFVGFGSQFDNDNFFRDAAQMGYNITLGQNVTHDVHVGFQWYSDRETLIRSSNGWGSLSVPGGRLAQIPGTGQSAYYSVTYQQQSTGQAAPIRAEYQSKSFELNDSIKWNNLSLNVGLLASNDTLFGQGLREDSSTLSGYVSAPGHRYKMYNIPFSKMLQPRVGVAWAYDSTNTVYASYARYNPAANSLPRAASWDRGLTGTFIDASFDQNGVLFAAVPRGSSSGKLFVQDMTPHTVDEVLAGTARQFTPSVAVRLYGRYRHGTHFWEDTNNDARVAFNPPAGIPRELYIPDLAAKQAQIGSGIGGYVIADLDGGFSKYYEGTLEAEWRDSKTYVRGSFTYMHYYGNFDQDDTTGINNDMNTFIGSSNIADAAGRQLWDFKKGTLRGDRPYMLKIYGARQLPWSGSAGFFFVAQAGQPWEMQSYEPYRALTTSTNDSNRYAEPAGSRRSDPHAQLDLTYTQNVNLTSQFALQVVVDCFNVFNSQTGYNIEPRAHNSAFGTPRSYYNPRRVQLAARFLF